MNVKVAGQKGAVHPRQLQRQNPADARRLDILQRRLGLASGTEAVAEAIAIAMLITEGGRRCFFIEEKPGGKLIRIDL